VDLLIPTFAALAARDLIHPRRSLASRSEHLQAAVAWLVRAHEKGGDGVSYGYSLRGGWRPPYRETSGYIAETFFDLAAAHDRPDYRERAIPHWADPGKTRPGRINHGDGGRGVYFEGPDGHFLEMLTRPYGSSGGQPS
jgi:hypothetical protein